ncbi:hypothetical protein NADFUDRAFT_50987 [Nadsonia fulvescens var. elongata DSM 6958]|uniref:Uncharacterized protein n=1 Tax=Nadsonia fulvescens var. elongata DSM 6958 TaxID=857566 RepID=A0A1E3PL76_9ASCO|nr:hypothetical protein NADFUDRAFT_50987 [Nadsonia fulvescens var. elongata DSM 6958]
MSASCDTAISQSQSRRLELRRVSAVILAPVPQTYKLGPVVGLSRLSARIRLCRHLGGVLDLWAFAQPSSKRPPELWPFDHLDEGVQVLEMEKYEQRTIPKFSTSLNGYSVFF